MWIPIRIKHRKVRKSRVKRWCNKSVLAPIVKFGSVAIVAQESGYLQPDQLEAARKVFSTNTKRYIKFWPVVFPDLPKSAKPKESRMGHGKGAFSHWVNRTAKGSIVVALAGLNRRRTKKLERMAADKLPLKVRLRKKRLGL